MKYSKCIKCNEFHWDNEKCCNEYKVYHYDYLGDDCKKMRGMTFEDVAGKYAAYYNDDGDLFNDTIEIEVENEFLQRKKFKLSAEHSVDYNIDELEIE